MGIPLQLHGGEGPGGGMWLPVSLGTNEQVLWAGLVPMRSKKVVSWVDEWLCGLDLSK